MSEQKKQSSKYFDIAMTITRAYAEQITGRKHVESKEVKKCQNRNVIGTGEAKD